MDVECGERANRDSGHSNETEVQQCFQVLFIVLTALKINSHTLKGEVGVPSTSGVWHTCWVYVI
jgi:hypothetical protein